MCSGATNDSTEKSPHDQIKYRFLQSIQFPKLRELTGRNDRIVVSGSVSTKLRRRGTVFRKSRKKKPGKWNFHSEKPPVDSLVDALVDSRLTGKSLIFGAFLSFVNHVNQEIKEKVKSNNRAPMDCFQSLFCRLTRFG